MTRLASLTRKILVVFASMALLLGGIVLLVLPGPGLLLILASLLLLGTEFDWAKRWSESLKDRIKRKSIRKPRKGSGQNDQL